METPIKFKDPDSRVDFTLDYTEHFIDDDTVTSAEIIAPEGITVEPPTFTNNKVTFWCSGGIAGKAYIITCRTVSQHGRIEDYSIKIAIRQR